MLAVHIDATPLERLGALLEPDRAERLRRNAVRARSVIGSRTVWNVNATATGGGVAEMLQALLAYGRGAGIDTRWLVLDGTPEFFALTKRIHNLLHGSPGDGGPLGEAERALYDAVLAENLESLREVVQPGDLVLLHDPQTAGLVEGVLATGAHVAWRCHVGRDDSNEQTDLAWSFLQPYVAPAHALIFSRKTYAPSWVDPELLWLIPPSLDPFTAKNAELPTADVQATLRHAGLVGFPEDHGSLAFLRRDGEPGVVRRHEGLIAGGQEVPHDARVVLQVSRWDRLKDMQGVLTGFVEHVDRLPDDAHLMLVGPDVSGVGDDPEGAEVLAECLAVWERLPVATRRRVHLCSLPMDDIDENAHLVNALQRHATVVVQKSLVEGFGLTVTEPMWKARPVLASRIGGIQDQIEDGESGLLLADPSDLDAFAGLLGTLLTDPEMSVRLGTAARSRVKDRYLGDRHLIQYVDLFEALTS
ncbi:MAG TPA: glycosyltransferase [Nocardioides sp.]|uniref:glycosyltransferase n=1 Tax=Nocardioides sp. TaxID=35761 RepID=UPI002C1B2EB9|nr:glycosyltransferase [Nocardioides sp.]HQR26585.1 glycosyltransferase [Nocardioides sp.]